MKVSVALLAYFAVSCWGDSDGEDDRPRLPACSSTASTPCRCPAGTQYLECVTVGVVGAAAPDVEKLTNDFYKIDWQLGAVPYKTRGPDNKVGAVRSVKYDIVPSGIEDVDEKLTEYIVNEDGSFLQRFEQVQALIPYPDKSGVFAGFWGTISGKATTGDETIVTFSNYACETAHIRNFAGFHEMALKNASAILAANGKVIGVNAGPVSAQSFMP